MHSEIQSTTSLQSKDIHINVEKYIPYGTRRWNKDKQCIEEWIPKWESSGGRWILLNY